MPWFNLDGIIRFLDASFQPESLEQLKSFLADGNGFPEEFKKTFPEWYWRGVRAGILAIPDFKD